MGSKDWRISDHKTIYELILFPKKIEKHDGLFVVLFLRKVLNLYNRKKMNFQFDRELTHP